MRPPIATATPPLMAAMDAVNDRFGRGTLKAGSIGRKQREAWHARFERRTPCYTTRWEDIPLVRA
jgi:DNA polymerase V